MELDPKQSRAWKLHLAEEQHHELLEPLRLLPLPCQDQAMGSIHSSHSREQRGEGGWKDTQRGSGSHLQQGWAGATRGTAVPDPSWPPRPHRSL